MDVTPKPNRPPLVVYIVLGGFAALAIGSLIFSPPAAPSHAVAAQIAVSLDDQIREVAKSEMTRADISGLSYEGVQMEAYEQEATSAAFKNASPDAVAVFVTYRLAKQPLDDSDEAQMSAALLRKLFALHPWVWWVMVRFDGPITDEYGHTDDRAYIDYATLRPTFSKIDWSGFDSKGLCKFLRGEDAKIIDTNDDTKGDNGCGLWPYITAQDIDPHAQ